MNNYYVYALYKDNTSLIRYIGVTNNPIQRLKNHIYESFNKKGKEYNLAKSRWIRKVDSKISIKILFTSTREACYNKEMELIKLAKKKNKKILNLTNGGDRPVPINELPNFKEVCEKISKSRLGQKASTQTIINMRLERKNRDYTYFKTMNKGTNNPMAYKVAQYSLDGRFIKTWDYAKQAVKELGLCYTSVSCCINGYKKTGGGFIWRKQRTGNNFLQLNNNH